jgi:phage shock protein C
MNMGTDQTEQAGTEGRKLLRRSANGRILGGVAAGLAKYFSVEVVQVRIVLVALSIIAGAGIPLYLAAWALIPEEGSDIAMVNGLLKGLS